MKLFTCEVWGSGVVLSQLASYAAIQGGYEDQGLCQLPGKSTLEKGNHLAVGCTFGT